MHQWYDEEGLKVGAVEVTQDENTGCVIEGTEFFDALGAYTTVKQRTGVGHPADLRFEERDAYTGFAVYNPSDKAIEIEVSFRTETEELETSVTPGPQGAFIQVSQ